MIRFTKIGHIGLYCRDIKKMTDFYTNVLGMKVSDVNERGMVFLRHGNDHHSFALVPMSEEEKKKPAGPQALQHIAFEVWDMEELKKIKKYLQGKGVKGGPKIKHEGPGGNYVYDFQDPEGNQLQFFCGMDQVGWDDRSRPKEQWNRFELDD
ncbi:VOC family protein [bacterium]|nr:MAG: VOC family protein [bacterium]